MAQPRRGVIFGGSKEKILFEQLCHMQPPVSPRPQVGRVKYIINYHTRCFTGPIPKISSRESTEKLF